MKQLTQQEYDSLVALAKFGRHVLDMDWSCERCGVDESLILAGHKHGLLRISGADTDLAKLPEGL